MPYCNMPYRCRYLLVDTDEYCSRYCMPCIDKINIAIWTIPRYLGTGILQ